MSVFSDLKEINESKFMIQNQKILLTYKGHLDKIDFCNWFDSQWSTKFLRLAHETGNTEVNYEHTHVLIDFGKRFQSKNCRVFDFEVKKVLSENPLIVEKNDIHPNIKFILGINHWENCSAYLGKEDPDNADLKRDNLWINKVGTEKSLEDVFKKYVKKPTDVQGLERFYEVTRERKEYLPPDIELQPWQISLDEFIKTKVDRSIGWIYDEKGGVGKSTFADWLQLSYPKEVLLLDRIGSEADAATLVQDFVNKNPELKCLILDLPRDVKDKNFYTSLENFKNGRMTVTKWHGEPIRFDKCHVWVFANFLPKVEKVSMDRWKIYEVIEKKLFRLDAWAIKNQPENPAS